MEKNINLLIHTLWLLTHMSPSVKLQTLLPVDVDVLQDRKKDTLAGDALIFQVFVLFQLKPHRQYC